MMVWDMNIVDARGVMLRCRTDVFDTAEVHDAALRLAGLLGVHIYDALIVAAALEASAPNHDSSSGSSVLDGVCGAKHMSMATRR